MMIEFATAFKHGRKADFTANGVMYIQLLMDLFRKMNKMKNKTQEKKKKKMKTNGREIKRCNVM